MRRQAPDNRRTGMPITAALEPPRGDRSTPEARLAEHLGSIRPKVRGFSVGGQLLGKLGSKREYGRLRDRLEAGTRKPRRRSRRRSA